MKYTLKLCYIALMLTSCNEDNEKVIPKNKEKEINPIKEVKETRTANFPIQEIMNNSEKRKSKYDLQYFSQPKTKIIPTDFFKKYLANFSLKNMKDIKLEFDKYSRYHFFDFVEFDEFVLFTIIHSDEIGYNSYYHYTYNKESDKIIDVVQIASPGGDGGHGQKELLFYSNSL